MRPLDNVSDSNDDSSDPGQIQRRWLEGTSRDLGAIRYGEAALRQAPVEMRRQPDTVSAVLGDGAVAEKDKASIRAEIDRVADKRESVYTDVAYRIDPSFRDGGGHIDVACRVALSDGRLAWLKPAAGEADSGREGLRPGQGARHSMASFEIDRALKLGVTPETRLIMTAEGEASIQDDAPRLGLPPEYYDSQDRQRMAVLDYVTAQTDRHSENYQTDEFGHPAAIDNGLCLSASGDDSIQSDFVVSEFGKQLDREILDDLSACDRRALSERLEALGISNLVIDSMFARVDELIDEQSIKGTSWQGMILSGDRDHRVK